MDQAINEIHRINASEVLVDDSVALKCRFISAIFSYRINQAMTIYWPILT